MLSNKLRELGMVGDVAMRSAIHCLSSWELENEVLDPAPPDENLVMDDRGVVTEFYMGSRLGANITYGILKQLLNHRQVFKKNWNFSI